MLTNSTMAAAVEPAVRAFRVCAARRTFNRGFITNTSSSFSYLSLEEPWPG